MEWSAILRVLRALNAASVEYVVVGGIAVNLHGLARATEDLDLFLRASEENVERLKRALRTVWDDPHVDEIAADDLCGDYPAVRYVPPDGQLPLDLITRLGRAFAFEDLEAEALDVEGVMVPVATPRTLIRMKQGTVRPIDHEDASKLRKAYDIDGEEEG